MKKRVFSGIKPSGDLHLGNYIGAISQWIKHQNEYENFFCIVDLHAITVPQDPNELHKQTRSLVSWYLAAGIDPEKSVIFIQSHNQDHAQLAWILNCYTGLGQLNRMTQYKDKSQKQKDFVSVGLFDYPVLMAADILLYDADLVPVGDDQKQHVELTRDIAERFNNRYEDMFKLPAYMPPPAGERIMSLQHPENKMSKSADDVAGTIFLADNADMIHQKVMAAVTDSGNEVKISPDKPAVSNLATIFMALTGRTTAELDSEYSGQGYKKFKADLAEAIVTALTPLQEKYHSIVDSDQLDQILADGVTRAREISAPKLEHVQSVVGLG